MSSQALLSDFHIKDLVLWVLAASIVYSLVNVTYRLYFHPLRHIPGPKIAAATQWYEFYYDVCKWPGGQYFLQIRRMHEVYGPIVRVSPFEVHIEDADYFDVMFSSTSKGQRRDKYLPAAHMTGTPLGTFGTVLHEVHRQRRAAVSNFFSQKHIAELEPYIYEKCDQLFSNLEAQLQHGSNVDLRPNFLAFSTDLICGLAFHRDYLKLLSSQDKALKWQKTISSIAALVPFCKQYPGFISIALLIPPRILDLFVPALARVVWLRKLVKQSAREEIIKSKNMQCESLPRTKCSEAISSTTEINGSNVFQIILSCTFLSPKEKSLERLTQEAFVFLAAGGETCSRNLAVGVFYVLSNRDRVLPPLLNELKTVASDPAVRIELSTLLRLPYLTALIREVLRITGLVIGRLPLISPDKCNVYRGYILPPGTPISMTLKDIQYDANIFNNPDYFMPERWLTTNPDYETVNRFHVSFSRGSRSCLGMNLAYAQLYIVFSQFFRRFDTELFDTTFERDIHAIRDCFIGEPDLCSRGIRIKKV